jgi:hypothetical protein
MGRSVDYLSRAHKVLFLHPELGEGSWAWDDFMEDVTNLLQGSFPSLNESEDYDGGEVRIFLRNRRAEFGVSEYCGLVSISARPLECNQALGERWLDSIWPKVTELMAPWTPLRKIGTFSNGEGVYEAI